MKKYIALLLVFFAFKASAQTDSADRTITLVLPKKAVILQATYIQETPSWKQRKMPDVLKPIVGSRSNPDSLITVVTTAGGMGTFISRVLSERYGAIYPVAQSIFHNSPAITGYTGLFQQIINKANGNSSEKGAAVWIRNRYLAYDNALQAYYAELYDKGFNWIQD